MIVVDKVHGFQLNYDCIVNNKIHPISLIKFDIIPIYGQPYLLLNFISFLLK